ncbi:MAG: ABC transporter ATP-binding protein [Anaerolineae bacterium]|nr:ABC transporter ATP-binding protein [Anaerolineae bacterium]
MKVSKEKEFNLQNIVGARKIRALMYMMHGYELKYFLAAVAIAISSMSRTATYLILQYFIDDYLTMHTAQFGLAWIALSFVILALLTGVTSYVSGKFTAETAEGTTRRLRDYLFDHLQHLPFMYHNQTDTGEMIQRSTSDVDTLRRFYANNGIELIRTVILFAVNFGAIASLNLRLALISIIVMPIIVAVSAVFFKRIGKAYEKYQEKEAALSTTLQENLSGVRVVKAFARQQYEIEKFDANNVEKYQSGRRLNLMHAMFWPMSDLICGAQMLVGFLIGGTMAINGTITVGTYMAYAGLIGWIIWPMRNLGRLIVEVSRGFVSFDRVTEIIKNNREPLDEGDYTPDKVEGKLVFNDVGFSYEDGVPVLEQISFDVQPGQSVALLGSTGSGKTTLVNLLPRFFEYTTGSITLDGVELKRYPRKILRQHIGTVEQEPFLFSRTIRENILYGVGKHVSEEEMIEAAKAAAIHDVILTFPNGYDTMVGERGVTLSGGQKQRVAIARTLLKNPKILVMDDSTSSVDTETESQIREALDNLMENRTTFIIAHRIQSIMNADQILVLDDKKIIQAGQHEQLLQEEEGMYRHIFDIQTRIEEELKKEIESVS